MKTFSIVGSKPQHIFGAKVSFWYNESEIEISRVNIGELIIWIQF